MGDLRFDAAQEAKPLMLRTREDGEIVEHSFEVLPLTRPQYEATKAYARRMADVEGDVDADQASMLAEFCDMQVRSTNGADTIGDLWRKGLIPLPALRQISDALAREAIGDPPA